MADVIGRKRAFFVCVLFLICSTLASAAAPGVFSYGVLRMLVGVGAGGIGIVAFVFASEPIGPTYQGVTGVMQSAFFSVGGVALAPVSTQTKQLCG